MKPWYSSSIFKSSSQFYAPRADDVVVARVPVRIHEDVDRRIRFEDGWKRI